MDVTDLPIKYDEKFSDRVVSMAWYATKKGYARHVWNDNGGVRWVSMHRLVWAWEHGWENVPRYIDHINGDRMDNRLENLRPTTLSLNSHNARRKKARKHSLPQGVGFDRKSGVNPYTATVSHAGKTLRLGVFPTVEEAEAVYRAAREKIMVHEVAVSLGQSPSPPDITPVRRTVGRPKKGCASQARLLHEQGMELKAIGAVVGCCSTTVRRLLKDAGVSLRRGRAAVDNSPSPGMLDARSSPSQESVE